MATACVHWIAFASICAASSRISVLPFPVWLFDDNSKWVRCCLVSLVTLVLRWSQEMERPLTSLPLTEYHTLSSQKHSHTRRPCASLEGILCTNSKALLDCEEGRIITWRCCVGIVDLETGHSYGCRLLSGSSRSWPTQPRSSCFMLTYYPP